MNDAFDHFQRLGFPRRFAIDPAELERAYLAASRLAHPDVGGSEADGATLNEAYATLNDPFRRAECLLSLLGGPSAAEAKGLPGSFLMDVMELRERAEAADGADRKTIAHELRIRSVALFDDVARQFEQVPVPLSAIRQLLNAAKYLRNLQRELRGA